MGDKFGPWKNRGPYGRIHRVAYGPLCQMSHVHKYSPPCETSVGWPKIRFATLIFTSNGSRVPSHTRATCQPKVPKSIKDERTTEGGKPARKVMQKEGRANQLLCRVICIWSLLRATHTHTHTLISLSPLGQWGPAFSRLLRSD